MAYLTSPIKAKEWEKKKKEENNWECYQSSQNAVRRQVL